MRNGGAEFRDQIVLIGWDSLHSPLGWRSTSCSGVILRGFYTVRPDERAALTSFCAAQKLEQQSLNPELSEDERERYKFPQVIVIPPGGPYLNALHGFLWRCENGGSE